MTALIAARHGGAGGDHATIVDAAGEPHLQPDLSREERQFALAAWPVFTYLRASLLLAAGDAVLAAWEGRAALTTPAQRTWCHGARLLHDARLLPFPKRLHALRAATLAHGRALRALRAAGIDKRALAQASDALLAAYWMLRRAVAALWRIELMSEAHLAGGSFGEGGA